MKTAKIVILMAAVAMVGAITNVQPLSAGGVHSGGVMCAPTQKHSKKTGRCIARNDPRFNKDKVRKP